MKQDKFDKNFDRVFNAFWYTVAFILLITNIIGLFKGCV